MKKLITIYFVAIIALIGINANSQTNYIENWDGNGATGTGSKPTDFGWGCTYASTSWNTANTSPGVRFNDVTTGYTYNGSPFTGRVLFVRWDSGQSTSDYYYYPMSLTACTSYTLDFKYIWWNNSTQPTYTYGISTSNTPSAVFLKSDTAKASVTKTIFKRKTLTFTAPTTGTYYFLIKASTAVLGAIGDMFVTQNATQTLSVNQTSFYFDKFNPTRTFTVTGNALSSDVTLTPPAGITLDKTTITAAEAQCGVSVTATYDQATDISNGNISITSDALSQNITVNAVSNNLTNATTALINPSFELGFSGWTNVGLQTQSNTSFPLKDATYYVEKWISSGSLSGLRVSQSISNLPNGYYQMTVAAFTQNALGGAYIFANSDSTQVFAANQYNVIANVTDGTLKVGFSVIASSNWVAVDNFRLTYLGSSYMFVDPTSLSFDAITLSKTFTVAGKGWSGDALLTAPAGINLSKTSVTIAEADAGTTITATYDKSVNIVDGIIAIQSGSINKTITVNAIKSDYTTAILNPSFESGFASWVNNGMQTQTNAGIDPFKNGGTYVEKWTATAPLALCGVTQTVAGLPNGMYTITASAKTELQGTPSTFPGGAYIIANRDSVEVSALGDYSVTTKVTDGTLMFGFHSYTPANWVAVDNFRLTAQPSLIVNVNNATNDSILFVTSGEQVTIPVSTLLFDNGMTITSDNPLFTTDVSSLPNIGGNIVVTYTGSSSATGNLTIAALNPMTPAPMQRIINGTSITVPMKATLTPTSVNNLDVNGLKVYIQNNKLITEFNLEKTTKISLVVYNANGVKIIDESQHINSGKNKMVVNCNIPSGVYLAKLIIDGKSVTQKLIK